MQSQYRRKANGPGFNLRAAQRKLSDTVAFFTLRGSVAAHSAHETQYPFLEPNEAEGFEQDYQRYPRQVVEVDPLRPNQPAVSQQRTLETLVRTQLRGLLENKAGFQCTSVSVVNGDGCSWSATAADRAAASWEFKRVRRFHLRGKAKPEGLPEIIAILPTWQFAKLARKYARGRPFMILAPGINVALIAAAVVLGALVEMIKALSAPGHHIISASTLLDPAFFLSALAISIFGIAAKYALAAVQIGTTTDLRELAKDLPTRGDPAHGRFTRELAKAFAGLTRRRVVIIDRFDLLDQTTKQVIEDYLAQEVDLDFDHELWVVLDGAPDKEFRRVWIDNQRRFKKISFRFFDQVLLSAAQRQSLATEKQHPERGHFETVKAIARDVDDQAFADSFARRRSPMGFTRYGSLEFFYVLAISSGWGQWLMDGKTIEEYMCDAQRVRSHVLRSALVGTKLGKNEIYDSLRDVRRDFAAFIQESPDHGTKTSFQINPEAGQILARTWESYGLVDPRLVHLYWALLWHNRWANETIEPFWINKLSTHLLETDTPHKLGLTSLEVTVALFEAILFTIGVSLRASLLRHISELMQRALSLVDSEDTEWRKRGRRLRTLCWQAYAVVGDDDILKIINTLQGWLGVQRVISNMADDPLEATFMQSIGIAGPPRWDRDQAAFRHYGRLRSGWLILTLKPFFTPGAFGLHRSLEMVPATLTEAARAAEARLATADKRQVVNYLTTSQLLWCLTLALSQEPGAASLPPPAEIIDTLETIQLGVEESRDSNQSDGSNTRDFYRAGAAQELAVLVRLCAFLLLKAIPRADFDAPMRTRIHELLTWDADLDKPTLSNMDEANSENRISTEIRRRLDLIQLMWDGLGYTQLAMFSRMRSAQLAFILPSDQQRAQWNTVAGGLSAEVVKPGYIGLLSNALAAAGAAERILVAALLERGVGLAIQGGMQPPLVTELSFVLIMRGHTLLQSLDRFVARLMTQEGARRAGRRFGSMLASLPDEEVATVTLAITNSLRAPEGPDTTEDVTAGVTKELDRRINVMPPTVFADEARQRLELFKLKASLGRGEQIDVDQTIRDWKLRQQLPTYDWLLVLLFGAGSKASPLLLEEAAAVLARTVQLPKVRYAAPLHLAKRLAIAEPQVQGQARFLAIELLKRQLPPWEDDLPPRLNIELYTTLRRFDAANAATYDAKVRNWMVKDLQTKSLTALRQLADRGQYFLVFFDYYEMLSYWGLQTDLSFADLNRRLGASGHERMEALRQWWTPGRELPAAFVGHAANRSFSSDFLCYGRYAFLPPAENEPSLDDLRRLFNAAAKRALDELYEHVTEMRQIPSEIRSILRDHRRMIISAGLVLMPA